MEKSGAFFETALFNTVDAAYCEQLARDGILPDNSDMSFGPRMSAIRGIICRRKFALSQEVEWKSSDKGLSSDLGGQKFFFRSR